jgi:hypothetical protein
MGSTTSQSFFRMHSFFLYFFSSTIMTELFSACFYNNHKIKDNPQMNSVALTYSGTIFMQQCARHIRRFKGPFQNLRTNKKKVRSHKSPFAYILAKAASKRSTLVSEEPFLARLPVYVRTPIKSYKAFSPYSIKRTVRPDQIELFVG